MRVRELGEGLWETGALEAGPREQRSEQVCEENEPVNKQRNCGPLIPGALLRYKGTNS